MSERFIRIVGFGLIGMDKDNGPFRQTVFTDEKTGDRAELLVIKKERPMLWSDIEKLEKGGNLPPYRGYITKLNGIDLVVFGNEDLEDVFTRRKDQLTLKSKISYMEAEAMREHSKGYITNLTHKGAMEISWRSIDKEARIIKFRAYTGMGKFVWGNWYEIERKKNE